jgi:hypothetical protein
MATVTMSLDSGLVKDCNRISHLNSDVQDFVALTMFSKQPHWSSSRSHFGRSKHSFLYQHPLASPSAKTTSSLEKDLARVQHLRSDIQDFVLVTLFSDVSLQFPQRLLNVHKTPTPHPFLFHRKKSVAQKVKPTTKTPVTSKPLYTTDAQIKGKLIRDRILFGQKSTPKFSALFPQTSWPNITFIQGHPTIDRDLFNKLLTSRLRAAKSSLQVDGAPAPRRFSPSLLKEFQRMINLSIRLEYDYRVTAPPANRSRVKPTKKNVQSLIKSRFQKSQTSKDEKLTCSESQTPLRVPEQPTISTQSALAIKDDPLPSRAFSLKYAVRALCECAALGSPSMDGKDEIYYFDSQASQALNSVKRAEEIAISYFRYIRSRFPSLRPYNQDSQLGRLVKNVNISHNQIRGTFPTVRLSHLQAIQVKSDYYIRTCNILGSQPLPDVCPSDD